MTVAELRGRLLSHFYNLRYSNGGNVPVTEEILSGGEPISREAIAGVCRELTDVGLIEWTPYLPGHVIGSARIRGPGVDAVERGSSASLEILFPEKPAPAVLDSARGAGALSSWWQGSLSPGGAGVLSPVEQTGSLEPLASREDARSAPSHMVETFGENTKSPLSAPSADLPPQREILTLKPTLWGMSIDLKELARRASAWWRARQ